MSQSKITLHADGSALEAAIEEFGDLLVVPDSELDRDGFGQFRKLIRNLFAESVLDFSNLVRVESHPAALGAGDVLVSLHPTELFLELLAALRAGDRDVL